MIEIFLAYSLIWILICEPPLVLLDTPQVCQSPNFESYAIYNHKPMTKSYACDFAES